MVVGWVGCWMGAALQLWKIDEPLFDAWLGILNRTRRGGGGGGVAAAAAAEGPWLWLPLFPDVARPNLDAHAARWGGGTGMERRLVWTGLFGQVQGASQPPPEQPRPASLPHAPMPCPNRK